MTKHLAILTQPFLDLILEGRKTIESRFGKVKCAPHGVVQEGDIVLLKETGGPVKGEFTVGKVLSFANITPQDFQKIQKYSREICADVDPKFWDARAQARYATLMYVRNVQRYSSPYSFPKKDRRGWVVIERGSYQPSLFQDLSDRERDS